LKKQGTRRMKSGRLFGSKKWVMEKGGKKKEIEIPPKNRTKTGNDQDRLKPEVPKKPST